MAKIRTIQSSFVSGEISPTVFGRVDTEIYAKAAGKLRNVYVRPQGGAFRREGQEFVDTTTSSAEGRLVPFEFNDEQTYVLAFTAGEFVVYRTDSNTVQATVSSSPISGLTTSIIKEMKWTQSADTLILVHKDLQPIKITRTSDTVWTAESITLANIPAFSFGTIGTSNPAGSITPDVKTGITVVTGVGTTFIAGTHVGQYINTPKGGRIFITAVNSTTELEGNVIIDLAATTSISTGDWELETGYEDVISATRGWARSVAFHKGRLVFGGLGERPQTLLFSKVADFFNFDLGTGLDDEAIDVTIDDDRVNVIANIFPGRGLQIFTTGGEFTIRGNFDNALTPSTVANQLFKETLHGSGNSKSAVIKRVPNAVSVDGTTIFVEGGGSVVRQFTFNDVEQSFNATNISILSEHLIRDPVAMDIRRSNDTHPADFVYLVNADGTVAVLNSLREQELLSWTLFETDGTYEDVAVSGREVYFIVKRNINGSDVRYVEKLNPELFMDASLSQTEVTPTDSWTGLSHLEGETVSLRGDDFIITSEVVASGALTTDEAVTTLEAGLNFTAKVTTLPIELIIQGQSFAGQYKSPVFANVRLYNSRQIQVEYNGNTSIPAFSEFGDDVLDDPVPTFTGWKKVFIGGVNRDVEVTITQTDPLEFNVLAIHFAVRV